MARLTGTLSRHFQRRDEGSSSLVAAGRAMPAWAPGQEEAARPALLLLPPLLLLLLPPPPLSGWPWLSFPAASAPLLLACSLSASPARGLLLPSFPPPPLPWPGFPAAAAAARLFGAFLGRAWGPEPGVSGLSLARAIRPSACLPACLRSRLSAPFARLCLEFPAGLGLPSLSGVPSDPGGSLLSFFPTSPRQQQQQQPPPKEGRQGQADHSQPSDPGSLPLAPTGSPSQKEIPRASLPREIPRPPCLPSFSFLPSSLQPQPSHPTGARRGLFLPVFLSLGVALHSAFQKPMQMPAREHKWHRMPRGPLSGATESPAAESLRVAAMTGLPGPMLLEAWEMHLLRSLEQPGMWSPRSHVLSAELTVAISDCEKQVGSGSSSK
ncbi:protein enabled homolog [Sceloporus undulatus]|uniref:protein enabled homolog n=1 Tax=Sceloporus undulatus TaxID=8520 RepID=UPI001C4B6796|nr:protein enabled homolog [Sceloporus undulatus]